MSRIAKQPIPIPAGVDVTVSRDLLTVKGPKGTLSRALREEVSVAVENGHVIVKPMRKTLFARALLGTYAAHVKNMLRGVEQPFMKKLVVEGIGYRSEVSGKNLTFSVGFSHPVRVEVPEGLTVTAEKNVISISGPDKELVGAFAAQVRSIKEPEPYKGKGIRYEDEVVRRKQGKRAVA